MIGALRMDVDNLGSIFSSDEMDSPSKLAVFSHQINYFFKAILNQICRGQADIFLFEESRFSFEPINILGKDYSNGRNVSVTYAGGDDLFIVGAWDEVVELAFDIQRCFREYCEVINKKEGKEVIKASISAGLTIHHPKHPLYQMAQKSGDAEKYAKHDADNINDKKNKNRIALFYDENKQQRQDRLAAKKKTDYMLSMTWQAGYDFMLPFIKDYSSLGELRSADHRYVFVTEKISYQTIEKWFLVTEKFQITGELYMSTMARVLEDVRRKLSQTDKELFGKLKGHLYKKSNRNISHLHIALNWLSFLRRTR
ncbi:hypothetical protein QUF80_04350 [Desulfococcaceae bacterium HSG8]|nr:hypothetical protein [Desulfococcaceae bacterium HSG8]